MQARSPQRCQGMLKPDALQVDQNAMARSPRRTAPSRPTPRGSSPSGHQRTLSPVVQESPAPLPL